MLFERPVFIFPYCVQMYVKMCGDPEAMRMDVGASSLIIIIIIIIIIIQPFFFQARKEEAKSFVSITYNILWL
jgi:hypothetical protein